jgi:hypothetical protein
VEPEQAGFEAMEGAYQAVKREEGDGRGN